MLRIIKSFLFVFNISSSIELRRAGVEMVGVRSTYMGRSGKSTLANRGKGGKNLEIFAYVLNERPLKFCLTYALYRN